MKALLDLLQQPVLVRNAAKLLVKERQVTLHLVFSSNVVNAFAMDTLRGFACIRLD
jgi:hypothetical protein